MTQIEICGTVSGSRWFRPALVQRLRAIADVNRGIYVRLAYADGTWFYCVDMPPKLADWVRRTAGIEDPEPPPEQPETVAAVDPDAETTTDCPRA